MSDTTSIREAVPLYVTLLVFGGQIGLPVFVATMMLSSKVRRHGSLINFCATWIIYSIVYCLTCVTVNDSLWAVELIIDSDSIYEGHWHSQNTQSLACRTQAVFVHGVAPLCVSTLRGHT